MEVKFLLDVVEEGADVDPEAAAALAAGGVNDAQAVATFRKAVRLDHGDPDYPYILGEALLRVGRFAESAAAFQDAILLDRANAHYHRALGVALWKLERHAGAVEAFREALRLQPDDTIALNGLGAALLGTGEARHAVETCRRALSGAVSVELVNTLAAALWATGDTRAAVDAFHDAVQRAPYRASFRRNLGRALAALGRHEESLPCFREALALLPKDAAVQRELGDALFASGQSQEAEAAYARATELEPTAVASSPHSRQAQQALVVERLRKELVPESPPLGALERRVWSGVLAAAPALRGVGRDARRALGRGRLVIALSVLGLLAYAGWRVVPAYVDHYVLKDAAAEVARAPVRDDHEVMEMLMHVVARHGLAADVRARDCVVKSAERWRTVSCRYVRQLRLLPGLSHAAHFSFSVEEPFFPDTTKEPVQLR
jgi:tetratricopeptide (TPR) repeat protein